MTRACTESFPVPRQARRTAGYWPVAAFSLALVSIYPTALIAQQSPIAIYTNGDAAVTGFSGASPPAQIAPGVDPNQKTFIDLGGPSLRIFDLQHMDGPAQAQLVGASKPFTVTAASARAGFRRHIRRQFAAQYLRGGGVGLRPADHCAGPGRSAAAYPDRRAKRDIHARSVGPARRSRIDMEDRRRDRQGKFVRQCHDHGRANSGAALGGVAYSPDSEIDLRRRSRERIGSSLWIQWQRAWQLRSWRSRTRGARIAAGTVDFATADRCHQPAVRQ